MKVLLGDEWKAGFLDYYCGSREYRIQVLAWVNLERLEGVYFVRSRSLRLVWNYLREVGPTEVLRKISSRSQERYRNEKYVSCGLGRVIESADEVRVPIGQAVAFLAPNHPPCVERIVLPTELIITVDQSDIPPLPSQSILYQPALEDGTKVDCWWDDLRAWSVYSGKTISRSTSTETMKKVLECLCQVNWHDAKHLDVDEQCAVKENKKSKGYKNSKTKTAKRAVLFGYGNYAKTIIIPNIKPYFSLDCIHELDPTQIPTESDISMRWNTSPNPRSREDCDVFLIAGFHHTHTPLAIYALQRGAYAVVEKPIVVDDVQLAELLTVMQSSTGQLWSCFHKRYLPLNKLAVYDLNINRGDPVSYHCIVYEVPLPELHWYRWPNSKSRLVSNGCHWIDHFLYLNDFCEVRSCALMVAQDGTINCSVSLENGAFFTMVLTDKGSERIGVQDYIELRANGVTVRMINGSCYVAEGRDRIIRKKRINKMQSYKVMYRQIGQKIVDGTEGDSVQSVRVSSELIMALENRLVKLLDKKGVYDETNPTKPKNRRNRVSGSTLPAG